MAAKNGRVVVFDTFKDDLGWKQYKKTVNYFFYLISYYSILVSIQNMA